MFQPIFITSAPPLLYDGCRVESRQILKPISVGLHGHSSLLKCKELNFPLVRRAVQAIFLKNLIMKVV